MYMLIFIGNELPLFVIVRKYMKNLTFILLVEILCGASEIIFFV